MVRIICDKCESVAYEGPTAAMAQAVPLDVMGFGPMLAVTFPRPDPAVAKWDIVTKPDGSKAMLCGECLAQLKALLAGF